MRIAFLNEKRSENMAESTHPMTGSFPVQSKTNSKVEWPIWKPTVLDFFFIATIAWLFALGPAGWDSLLADGDTGWHIRAGEYILKNKKFIHEDFFSFSRPGQLWFAWEWLSEVWFAVLNSFGGLKAVVLYCGVVITLSFTLMFRHMIWRGATPLVAMGISLVATGAASNHYLARPHVITFLFLAVSLFQIDVDRTRPTKWLWSLIPLTVLWTNLHGGFFSLIACLGLVAIGSAMAKDWTKMWRYGILGCLCLVSSVINPYGIALHKHMVEYLQSDWIKSVVEEFQSPSFRKENVLQFEGLMFLGIGFAGFLISRKKYVEALLILFWAHNALASVRHISVFVLVASPIIAAEISHWLRTLADGKPKNSVPRILESMSDDLRPACMQASIWLVAAVIGLALWNDPKRWPQDFPKEKFPVAMVSKHAKLLTESRVLAPDEWGDYMIYRFFPEVRVFFDGRSDFYGQTLGKDYIALLQGSYEWEELLKKHNFTAVFIPPGWPLASILKRNAEWKTLEDDGNAILFIKRTNKGIYGKLGPSMDDEKKVPLDLMKNPNKAEITIRDGKS